MKALTELGLTPGEIDNYYKTVESREAANKINDQEYAARNISEKQHRERKRQISIANFVSEIESLMKDWGYYELYKKELERLSAMESGFNAMTAQDRLIAFEQRQTILAKTLKENRNEAEKAKKIAEEDYFWKST